MECCLRLQDLNDVELCYLDYVNEPTDSTDSSERGATMLTILRMTQLRLCCFTLKTFLGREGTTEHTERGGRKTGTTNLSNLHE
jgi:hypothetical protein